MSEKHKCFQCNVMFSTKGSLVRHQYICKDAANKRTLLKCLEGCNSTFRRSSYLRDHLIMNHDFKMEEIHIEFDTSADFQTWLKNEEAVHNIKFSKANGSRKHKYFETSYLYCMRSGKRKIVSDELRQRKHRVVFKLGHACTCQIVITRQLHSDKCSMVYFSTHYGHENVQQNLVKSIAGSFQQIKENINGLYYSVEELQQIAKQLKELVGLGSEKLLPKKGNPTNDTSLPSSGNEKVRVVVEDTLTSNCSKNDHMYC